MNSAPYVIPYVIGLGFVVISAITWTWFIAQRHASEYFILLFATHVPMVIVLSAATFVGRP